MNEMVEMTKKFINVDMDNVMISTDSKMIIGTSSLATCTGVLIYSEKEKKAIVAHISSYDYKNMVEKIFKLIISSKLYRSSLKYKIIYGGDRGEAAKYHGIIEYLEKHFDNFPMEKLDNLSLVGVRFNEDDFSNEFAFDASRGIFVTDKVFFGTMYHIINDGDCNIINKKYNK